MYAGNQNFAYKDNFGSEVIGNRELKGIFFRRWRS
jgi:hypothetical protein